MTAFPCFLVTCALVATPVFGPLGTHQSSPLFEQKRDPCGLKRVAPLVRWPVRWLLLNKSVITLPYFWMTWLTRLEWHLRNLVGPISRTWCARPEKSPTLTPIREWERTEARFASPTRTIFVQEWFRKFYHERIELTIRNYLLTVIPTALLPGLKPVRDPVTYHKSLYGLFIW